MRERPMLPLALGLHESATISGAGIDDPDAFFYENYKCGSSRNYTDYCSEEMDRLIDRQSQELDRDKRLKLVWEIQRKLGPAPLPLQLRADAGGVAGPVSGRPTAARGSRISARG